MIEKIYNKDINDIVTSLSDTMKDVANIKKEYNVNLDSEDLRNIDNIIVEIDKIINAVETLYK